MRTAFTMICLTVALALTTSVASARVPNDVISPAHPTAIDVPDRPVIRELHTVVRERDAGRTLSTVLAGAALLVAFGTTGYMVILTSARKPV